ncbi:MAG: hypothetical protein B6U77_00980 [Candidatus Hecatellales archaeon ex4484_218]|nr:MAG: hypothetical protein B6U77_00980 [Candidatus Hecatellales archaeon ex4484_218]
MRLFKVFLDRGFSRENVAENVSVATKNGLNIELFDVSLKKLVVVEKAEIVKVDTLNEVLILKPVDS